jgi:hypothetical protein
MHRKEIQDGILPSFNPVIIVYIDGSPPYLWPPAGATERFLQFSTHVIRLVDKIG